MRKLFFLMICLGILTLGSTAVAGDICTLPGNSNFLMLEGVTLTQLTTDIPGEMIILGDDKQPTKETTDLMTKIFNEDWSDAVSVWDEGYNTLIVHRADLTDCLSDSPVLIIPAE